MKPISTSEQMMFNTVRLETQDGSSGTGFFFHFKYNEQTIPILITNKHVVNFKNSETVNFFLHLKEEDGSTKENFNITLTAEWYFHPDKDLCFTFMAPIFEKVEQIKGKPVFYMANDEEIVPSNKELMELSALEEIVMIGYPIGLWDMNNNFPIFRKGYTASHPAYDFNNKGIALADISVFPGSSGSPIYILNETGYSDKKGNTYLGRGRLIFLGVLFAGPVQNINGNISVVNTQVQPQFISEMSVMTNLGYYIKAEEILEFKTIIQEKIDSQSE